MAPLIRLRELERMKEERKNAKQAAVLSLFYNDAENQTQLLLILRKTYKGVHSNQIGFPGGKVEQTDTNLQETALRETFEEVGVNPLNVTVIKELTQLYIPPSNFEVMPYLGFFEKGESFQLQEDEVEAIVEVSLTDFMSDKNVIRENLSTSYAKNIDVPAFKLNNYVVWGATAMILNEVKALLKQVL